MDGSVVSPVVQESGARLGALPAPRVKLKCTRHTEVDWTWAGLPAVSEPLGLGSRRKKREAGGLIGAGVELAPEISTGSHWLPSVFVLLFFKTLHFEIHVSESFLPHNGTMHRLPHFVCSPLPPTPLNQPQTNPRH